jgi:hypothetical protein
MCFLFISFKYKSYSKCFKTGSPANDSNEQPLLLLEAPKMAQKLCGLWKRGELTDIVLVASDGRELPAHRAVLGACSQVLFNSMQFSA